MEHKLQQVFLNLFLNAKDAMPKGGWLSVRTAVEPERVMVELADTGGGIPSEHLARIYDPFFTTKSMNQGTGLGLSITYGIVREHDGTIECDSTVGQGTRFVLSFPVVPVRSRRGRDATAGPMRRHSSVLVIDDEEVMREILESLLTADGHRVTTAGSGEEGLALARSSSFDAAVVDVMLPGMDGIETMQELKKLDDELPVVLVTAFASVETAIAAMKRGAFDYITKPFKNDEVLVVVRNAVERRQLIAENAALRQSLQAQAQRFSGIIGRSARMKQVFNLIVQAAPEPLDDPDHRRERNRQGAGGAGDPRQLVPQRPRVRDGQLGQPAAGSARVHALRPRQGRLHRRHQPEAGLVRPGRQGHALLRRDRQHRARDAGQAAPR